MFNSNKRFITFSYLALIMILLYINSIFINQWLNKSLFTDFIINSDYANESFFQGTVIIFLLLILVYSLVGTFTVSLLISNGLFIGLIVANSIKVSERNEFITFSELQTIASPRELLSFVEVSTLTATLVLIGVIIFLIALQWFVIKLIKKMNLYFSFKSRLILLIVSFSLLVFIYMKPNYVNEHYLKYETSDLHNFNPVTRAQKDGYLSSFLHTIKPDYMEKPLNYDKSKMTMIYEKYKNISEDVNAERNNDISDAQTILYLSESLMDPATLPNLLENETSIPFIHKLSNDNIGGTMYSQYMGGGTANIEWSLLTSFSLEAFHDPVSVTPYSDFYMDSKNHKTFLSSYTSNTVAIHPYTAHLYKRKSVYDAIGFDEFNYLNHGIKHTNKLGTQTRVSDEALNKDIFRYLDKGNTGLMHVLTMQNHSPYSGEISDMNYQPEINLDVFPEDKEEELANYLQSSRASDIATRELVAEIDNSNRDVNLLFYGDHFPSPFRGLEDQFHKDQLHETPWFIYMNKQRSEKNTQFAGLSPAFLIPVLLQAGNYYVTPLQGLMDELLNKGVKRIGDDFIITEAGRIKNEELTNDLSELVQDYKAIMYDALFGNDWLKDDFYTEVFK